jgi:hypothetical protein
MPGQRCRYQDASLLRHRVSGSLPPRHDHMTSMSTAMVIAHTVHFLGQRSTVRFASGRAWVGLRSVAAQSPALVYSSDYLRPWYNIHHWLM